MPGGGQIAKYARRLVRVSVREHISHLVGVSSCARIEN